jgi:hypothetical protein
MINNIQYTIIYTNNFELQLNEKTAIKYKINEAIKKYNCNVFDFSDGENLIPIKYNTDNDYIIPNDFIHKNQYLQKNNDCLELLNKCDKMGYKFENIIKMDRYLFDFDFDNNINLNDTIQTLKDNLIRYQLKCRCVYTGNRGVHIVIQSNEVNTIKRYQNI